MTLALRSFFFLALFQFVAIVAEASGSRGFDYRTWNHWRVEHRMAVVKPGVMAFAWMNHRAMCGGAVTDVVLNRKTYDLVQAFQGCYGVLVPGTTEPTFHRLNWMK